jgi:hypothetical protein
MVVDVLHTKYPRIWTLEASIDLAAKSTIGSNVYCLIIRQGGYTPANVADLSSFVDASVASEGS